jgi:hypothetical protein
MTLETQSAFARRISRAKSWITQLKQAGLIVMDESGRLVDVEASIQRIRKTDKPARSGVESRRQAEKKKSTERVREWKKSNPEKARASNNAKVERLTPAYVAALLKMKVSEVTPELLELKREQIDMYRLVSQLNQEINETNHENHHE